MRRTALFLTLILLALGCANFASGQTASVIIYYSGAQAWGCCNVCGTDYMCIGSSGCGCCQPAQQTKTFIDPVPAGNMITSVTITYYAADCSAPNVPSQLNGCLVGTASNLLGTNSCACGTCNPVTCTANYPTGFANYNYGGVNVLYSDPPAGTEICVQRCEILFTYTPGTPVTTIPAPGAISGPITVCPGQSFTYSIAAVPGATTYNWTVPAGATITSGQGTTSITVTMGASAGQICVTASNGCQFSVPTCLNVTLVAIPPTPGPIIGATNECQGQTVTYSVSPVAGATSYSWTVPAGYTINSGQGSTSISVTLGGSSGQICVTALNGGCPSSAAGCLTISPTIIPAAPVAISGNTTPCSGQSSPFSVTAVTGAAFYTWSVPSGSTITSGQGTTSINVSIGTTSGQVCVVAGNTCGTSAPTCLSITIGAAVTAPTPVTASPATMCAGSIALLNATAPGYTIGWYNSPTGGTLIGTSASGANFSVSPGVTTTYYAEAFTSMSGTQTFNYTGGQQTWVVPPGVTSITVDVRGAEGGTGYGATELPGKGGRIQTTLSTTPGQTIYIYVGGQGGAGGTTVGGAAGFNGGGLGGDWSGGRSGGGGGGASDIRQGGNALANRVVVAGGGGGCGVNHSTGDAGGGGGGTNGINGMTGSYFGTGGTQSAGGTYAAGLGTGGAAIAGTTGGGGGGGYYGGGGSQWEGGGGGSSYPVSATHTQAFQSGNGQVLISYSGNGCVSGSRTAVTVSIGPPAAPTPVVATPASLCVSGSTNLTATAPGYNIAWYTSSTGGTPIGTSASGANFNVTPTVTTTYYAETFLSSSGSQTFNYTGGQQTWTVPAGVTSITVDVQGAEGGTGYGATELPGKGGRVQTTLSTTPGTTLYFFVGGQGGAGGTTVGGAPGYNGGGLGGDWSGGRSGGGGGGASDIRQGGNAIGNRVIIAGGGGGCGVNHSTGDAGGAGGGTTGVNGMTGTYFGTGGSQTVGGTYAAGLGVGGAAIAGTTGGGGGGGYYGGGGSQWEGGGGGSSYPVSATHTQGYKSGNGQISISWAGNSCISASRSPVTVTITPNTVPGAVTGGSTICPGNTTGILTLSGNTGTVQSWEYSTNGGITWNSISNTNPTYSTTLFTGGTYWYHAIVQNSPCPAQASAYTVVTVPPINALSMTSGNNGTCYIYSPNSFVYILDPANNLIAGVFDATAGNHLLNTIAYLYIDPSVQIHPYTGEPYLQRHFQITPTSAGPADIKLYFTLAEFQALQAASPIISSVYDLVVTKFDDAGVWANAVYYPSPTVGINDPWPNTFSLTISVTSFSKFYIHGHDLGGPLPVDLTDFTADCKNGQVELNWTTVSENNNELFIIERSGQELDWVEIGSVPGSGNSNQTHYYNYVDHLPLTGPAYYRILQKDYNGSTTVYSTSSVTCDQSFIEPTVEVFPNPTSVTINVRLNNISGNIAFTLYDLLGQTVLESKHQVPLGDNPILTLDMMGLNSGLYHLEVRFGEEVRHFEIIRK